MANSRFRSETTTGSFGECFCCSRERFIARFAIDGYDYVELCTVCLMVGLEEARLAEEEAYDASSTNSENKNNLT